MSDKPPMNAAISLTPAEERLMTVIVFDPTALHSGNAKQNGEAAAQLFKSLATRSAIPEVRLKYFTDPAYNPTGRGRSWKQIFERNGSAGDDMLTHPHFLRFLQYFISGPSLPQQVVSEFRAAIEECGQVTSSDVVPLGKLARQLARSSRLQPHAAYEEFYKLALDCGLWYGHAEHIRSAVRKMR
jgi:hypothetical protein